MCWVLYLAAAAPLPLIPWDASAPAFNVTPLKENEEPVRAQFTLPHVVYVGAHTGCGCGFDPGQANPANPDEAPANVASLAALRHYLHEAATSSPHIELYVCWDGDQGKPADHHLELAPDDLQPTMTWFPERTLVSLRPLPR